MINVQTLYTLCLFWHKLSTVYSFGWSVQPNHISFSRSLSSSNKNEVSVRSSFSRRGSNDQATPEPSRASSIPLIDLQTLLKLCGLVKTGGEAKQAIQGGKCSLNKGIETRRAKKLFPGDKVSFAGKTVDVSEEVSKRGYVYKVKVKKPKPVAKVDADGNLEFGGRYRSEEWRKERMERKADRKAKKKGGNINS
mmetsp:Transcript_26844/g.61799  ORF Transcript_26844/g.61799 Transcript_26844/m.61799 type:complete len:194 (-) Transcript_26844:373-954(-)